MEDKNIVDNLKTKKEMEENKPIDYLELEEEEFKMRIFEEIERLSKEVPEENKHYIVRRWEEETTAKGMNIRTIDIEAPNRYKFFLDLYKIMKQKSTFDLFGFVFFKYTIQEEVEDDNDDLRYDLRGIVEYCMDNFRDNDSFWYETY